MSTSATSLIQLLKSYSTITATVDADSGGVKRIYNKFAAQGTRGKFLVINEMPGTTPNYFIGGDADLPYSAWQIDCYAETDLQAEAIGQAVRAAMEAALPQTIGGVTYYEITFSGWSSDSVQIDDGSGYRQHRYMLTMQALTSHATT